MFSTEQANGHIEMMAFVVFQESFSLSLLQGQEVQEKQHFHFRKKNSFLNGRNALSLKEYSLFNMITLYSISSFL